MMYLVLLPVIVVAIVLLLLACVGKADRAVLNDIHDHE